MDWQLALTLGVVFLVVAGMMFDLARPEVLVGAGLALLALTGVLTPAETLAGFANPVLATLAALFVLSAGLRQTGVLDRWIATLFARSRSESVFLANLCPPLAGMSAFLNNAPIVASVTPVVLEWTRRYGHAPSRVLIPLSYATVLGSSITLIGTSVNLTVAGLVLQSGLQPMGLFELAPVGIPVCIAGLAYLVLGASRVLPGDRPSEGRVTDEPRRAGFRRAGWRVWCAPLGLVAMVGSVALGWVSTTVAAVTAAGLVVASGCLGVKDAGRSIDASVLFVIGSGFGLAFAMDKTGAAETLAMFLTEGAGPFGAVATLVAVYAATLLLAELLHHAAAAALMVPVAISAAAQVGAEPRGFVFAVAIAATCAFANPATYQTHLMVYGPGGYRFRDFVRVGLPLDLVVGAVALLLIPRVWPFKGDTQRKALSIMQANHEAHGGALKNLYLEGDDAQKARAELTDCPSWELDPRQICDLELLLNGAFSPLEGFLTERETHGVLTEMRLPSGVLWPIPIHLDVSLEFANQLGEGQTIALRDPEGVPLAILRVSDRWRPDKRAEARAVFGTEDRTHPGVRRLFEETRDVYLGGEVRGLVPPTHYDFRSLRESPAELRARFRESGWERVVAFQTRNPMHRAHYELTLRAAKDADAKLLIQPVVGVTKPGDVDHFTRVRCYEHALREYPKDTAALSLLPLAMRMAGPREAVWHAIIRRNFGCTHFIVGRDHAGPGLDANGEPFYGPYDAQDLLRKHEHEIGIEMVPFQQMVYVENRDAYEPLDRVRPEDTTRDISGTEFRRKLRDGEEIATWFSFPEVIEELRASFPPRHRQGFTVFFTGLSGSGKSTVANALLAKLLERGGRSVILLDGDIVRKNLSSELGFSREHRDLNIRRIGYVASEITKSGGIAICAPIAPYAATRAEVRREIEAVGGFLEVHVSTPLAECERRDRKGLYAKARAGLTREFTGISDPYEAPATPELRIDTTGVSPEQATSMILSELVRGGYLGS